MRAVQWEVRIPIVVEAHRLPRRGLMAVLAARAVPALVNVVGAMTRETVCAELLLVEVARVAGRAGQLLVRADERVVRVARVVEAHLRPTGGGVTRLALGAEAAFVLVVERRGTSRSRAACPCSARPRDRARKPPGRACPRAGSGSSRSRSRPSARPSPGGSARSRGPNAPGAHRRAHGSRRSPSARRGTSCRPRGTIRTPGAYAPRAVRSRSGRGETRRGSGPRCRRRGRGGRCGRPCSPRPRPRRSVRGSPSSRARRARHPCGSRGRAGSAPRP